MRAYTPIIEAENMHDKDIAKKLEGWDAPLNTHGVDRHSDGCLVDGEPIQGGMLRTKQATPPPGFELKAWIPREGINKSVPDSAYGFKSSCDNREPIPGPPRKVQTQDDPLTVFLWIIVLLVVLGLVGGGMILLGMSPLLTLVLMVLCIFVWPALLGR
jgi:hypothetical protein